MLVNILQATYAESLRFTDLLNQDRLSDRWTEFLEKNVEIHPKGIYKYLWWYKDKIRNIVMSRNIWLINDVKEKRDKDYESIYIWVDFSWVDGRKSLPDSEILDVLPAFGISLLDLFDKCTKEQYLRMIDQITFKSFEQTEKYHKYNNQALSKVRSVVTNDMAEMRDIVKRTRSEWWFNDIKDAKFIIETE